jgi:hypothetical protein
MDRHQVPGMRMSPDQKYINNQALQQKRAKAHSGLAQFNKQLSKSDPSKSLNLLLLSMLSPSPISRFTSFSVMSLQICRRNL